MKTDTPGLWIKTKKTFFLKTKLILICCETDKYINHTNLCNVVTWYRLGKDDKDKRVRLKYQVLFWWMIHEEFV